MNGRSLHTRREFVMLEPYAVKVCAVVRIEKFLIQLGEVQSK